MLGNTHIALALGSVVVVREVSGIEPLPVEVLLCVLGGLLPDIDEPGSTISRPGNLVKPYVPRGVRVALNILTRGVSVVIKRLVGHRTVTHWPVIAVGLFLFAYWRESRPALFLALGFSSHLLGDLITRHGIPLWAPFSRKNVSLFPLKVGSLGERIFAVLLWSGLTFYAAKILT